MKQQELVSVVVTLYNKEKYIARCLKSILQQSYTNMEILVIDDGSTDRSALNAKEIVSGDSRFKILTKKNGGLSSARNYGIDRAIGDYIIFIDGDDCIEPDFVSNLIRFKKYDLVIAGFYELINGKISHKCEPKEIVVNRSNFKQYIFDSSHYFYCVLAWNKLFNLSIIKKNHLRYKDIVMGEDAGFVFNYLHYCKTFKVISNADYCNVIIPDTLSRSKVPNLWEHNLDVVNEVENSFDLDARDRAFLIMRSVKVTLGASSYNQKDFKTNLIKIRKSKEFNALRAKDIQERFNKYIYFGIKFYLVEVLRFAFKMRVKQHS